MGILSSVSGVDCAFVAKEIIMKKRSKLLFCVLTVAFALLVLTGAIATVLLLSRPFYAIHLKVLNLSEGTPWTEDEILCAFDEMISFCLLGTPFGTGVLRWSESGKSHFADCAKLFRLDFAVLSVSLLILIMCLILRKKNIVPARPLGRGCTFWGGILLSVSFAVIAILAASDFDAAFVIFHKIFFPGKENWLFDYNTDEIIRVLPQVFFRNCAIAIVALILLGCTALIVYDFLHYRKKKNK